MMWWVVATSCHSADAVHAIPAVCCTESDTSDLLSLGISGYSLLNGKAVIVSSWMVQLDRCRRSPVSMWTDDPQNLTSHSIFTLIQHGKY
ncbi:hypothetical protein Pelo_18318 [Pelomyxa schiedti]|nr:hypothetical protein Pelo_18318 [Pelomyxa schiedti]